MTESSWRVKEVVILQKIPSVNFSAMDFFGTSWKSGFSLRSRYQRVAPGATGGVEGRRIRACAAGDREKRTRSPVYP